MQGAIQPPRSIESVKMALIAPAAEMVWPMYPLVDEYGTRRPPNSRRRARTSLTSPAIVEVPWVWT